MLFKINDNQKNFFKRFVFEKDLTSCWAWILTPFQCQVNSISSFWTGCKVDEPSFEVNNLYNQYSPWNTPAHLRCPQELHFVVNHHRIKTYFRLFSSLTFLLSNTLRWRKNYEKKKNKPDFLKLLVWICNLQFRETKSARA